MKKKRHLSIAFICLGFGSLFAQQNVMNAGNNATGSNGNVSYSVGQIAYGTNSGSGGSVSQGTQQPYEVMTVLGTEDLNVNLKMAVHPNPTANSLSLEIKNYDTATMSYAFFDLSGRLIESNTILGETTSIQIQKYPASVYLLRIFDNKKEVKTFKIIKN
jgi:hypothetical protein